MSSEDETVPLPPIPPDNMPSAEEKQWAMFAHLSTLSGFIIPFGNILGPLIIWQIKKNEMPFVDDQGKEALNFQITVLIAALVAAVLTMVLIGLLLLPIIVIGWIVLSIMAGMKANNGEAYRYPFTLRLIK